MVSNSKPGTWSIEPNTRKTCHAGRVSPKGLTTPWKLCARPSVLMNVPAVSVKGEMGSSTSLMSMLALKGDKVTTISAWPMACAAAAPLAASKAGSVFSNTKAFKPPANI